ncbi:MAG: cytochrome P450 [Omnitrophica WOR_2 bacterium]
MSLLAVPASFPPEIGFNALQAMLKGRSVLPALELFYQSMGEVFQIPLPGFNPVFLVGPEANRFVLATDREKFLWRPEGDPVARLLRQGVLVTDGDFHDEIRHKLNPSLHKSLLSGYGDIMVRCTDRVTSAWKGRAVVDMLAEMRRLALMILMECLFDVDIGPDLQVLWQSILHTLAYISPGAWVFWPGIPRPGYQKHLRKMDEYLYHLIRLRRKATPSNDLLSLLIADSAMNDDLIRDQLLTLFIAGHDTSTALLSWTLYLLGKHTGIMDRLSREVIAALGSDLPTMERAGEIAYLDRVVKESLRLYPPIHIGMRRAAVDLTFRNYHIPAGTRVVYSIFLSHRQPQYWPDPLKFDPERFTPEINRMRLPYTYVPFGGGPRNCIGMAFAQVEAKVILARLLQQFEFQLLPGKVYAHMGATLEPRPGVRMKVTRRLYDLS